MANPKPSAYRHSRYTLISHPPKYLSAIVRQLEAARKRKGAFIDKNQLRSVIAKTDRKYETKGECDDIARFFMNEGVIIDHDDGRLYYDHDRAQVIIGCAARGTVSPPAIDPRQRVAAIIAANEYQADVDIDEISNLTAPPAEPEPETLDLKSLPLEEQKTKIKAAIALLRAKFGR